MAEIKYNADQHKQFQDELQKIGDGFSDLITELGMLKHPLVQILRVKQLLHWKLRLMI